MKKNRLLILASALLVGVLTGCGGPTDNDNGKPDGGDGTTTTVPTEEGKVTFFFAMDEASVQLESYASVYLTGGWMGFSTGLSALELTKMENSNVYYVIADVPDISLNQGNEYQLLLGYNKSSNMPEGKCGLQWTDAYKSDSELELEALKNPTFEYTAGQTTIDLGTHKFSTAVTKPAESLKNYKLVFNFETAVPDYADVFVFGSFNGWQTPTGKPEEKDKDIAKVKAAKCEPSADRKSFTYAIPEIYAGSYELALCVEYNTVVESITWNKVDECLTGNYKFEVMNIDGDNFDNTFGITFHMDFATKLPDPNLQANLKIVLENSGTGTLGENVQPGICGGFTNWQYTAMTKVGENYELSFEKIGVGSLAFGIINMNEGGTSWVGKIAGEGGANLAFDLEANTNTVVTVKGDFSKLGVEESVGTLTVTK